ncbi:hypothetical protein HDU93_005650 [Gonapodya sp. JEL0774]|nr:hypothetical protein HDU93_005650 [Gonapodya sp. JEL0774]
MDRSCDYVIVFNKGAIKHTGSFSALRQRAWQELITRVSDKKLGATVECKSLDKDRLVLCVKVCDESVLETMKQENRREYVAGGPTDLISSDPAIVPQSTRLRIVYNLLTEPLSKGGAGISLEEGIISRELQGPPGTADLVNLSDFVEAVFPLMDTAFNKEWIPSWASKRSISFEDLTKVRNVYGERVAFYFAFEQFYNFWLLGLAGPSFSLANALEKLGVNIQSIRDLVIATGLEGAVQNVVAKITVMSAMVLGFAAMTAMNAIIFSIDTFLNEARPFKDILLYVPMTIFLVLGSPLGELLTSLARRLSKAERHQKLSEQDRDLTFKMFVLQSMAAFLPGLFLTFSGKVWWLGKAPRRYRLQATVTYLLITNQVKNAVMENVVPFVQRAVSKEITGLLERGADISRTLANADIRGAAREAFKVVSVDYSGANTGADPLLDQIKREIGWTSYDDFADYSEMVVQFGNVVLFSIVFPLAPMFALANNLIELRSDAFKFAYSMRRPVPSRAADFRGWEDAMSVLTWLASVVNPTIVVYFSRSEENCQSPEDCNEPLSIDIQEAAASLLFAQALFFVLRYLVRGLVASFPVSSVQAERAHEREAREAIMRRDQSAAETSRILSFESTVPEGLMNLLERLDKRE